MTTEDEIVGWHHGLNGHGFGWTLGVGDGQGGLVSCRPWGHKEIELNIFILLVISIYAFTCLYINILT